MGWHQCDASLAGAGGVVGVAIGFGAQTMVKDFLSGFTIILEDLYSGRGCRVCWWVYRLVEKIALRKVQMRDLAGTIYTISLGEITTVQNLTKDFSYYVMDIGVTYHVDTDRVVEVLRQVDEDLRADSEQVDSGAYWDSWRGSIADSAVVVKARIKTRPIKQWFVGREFNRRMKAYVWSCGVKFRSHKGQLQLFVPVVMMVQVRLKNKHYWKLFRLVSFWIFMFLSM